MKFKSYLSIPLLLFILTGCGDKYDESLRLHLAFDETSGAESIDSANKLDPAKIFYSLGNGTYQTPVDPQWRENGIKGGALQFDGYSNFIRYDYEDLKINGNKLTIDVWVAPRAYEWLDYNGNKLTSIVSQHSINDNQGFILGMSRHGEWSFQVGLGDRWVEIWDDNNPLEKYEWSHITAVFDGEAGEMRLYKNSELINTELIYKGAKISPALEVPLTIGKNSESDTIGPFSKEMFSGLMDELSIYSEALDESKISKLNRIGLEDGEIKTVNFEDIWFDTDVLVDDIYKPTYHTSAPQHWMNEPHAPLYYNGKYHLFYQFNPFGPYWQQIHWGHWVSDDMINWTNVREALSPTKDSVAPDGIWSGGATYKNDGTPVLLFTAGDDSRTFNSISNQNIGLATPSDVTDETLTDWVMNAELAVKQSAGEGRSGEFRDPHIWKEDDTWYMLVCTGSTKYRSGDVICYTTTDDSFMNWTYRGSVYEWNAPLTTYGTSWELPIILPIKYTDGRDSGKYLFSISPAPAAAADNDVFYWIGTFDKTTYKFTPDFEEPKRIDYGNNVFTGPSAFIDPNTGNITMFSIIQDQRTGNDQYNSGWAHGAGLPRVLTLNNDNTLNVQISDSIQNNIGDSLLSEKDITLAEANDKLSEIKGDTLRIYAKIKNVSANKVGVYVRQSEDKQERTQFFCDIINNKVGVNTGLSSMNQNIKGVFDGPLQITDDEIEIELYLDRSIIEGFFNDSNSVTARIYPTLSDALGIEFFAEGGDIMISELEINQMQSIYNK